MRLRHPSYRLPFPRPKPPFPAFAWVCLVATATAPAQDRPSPSEEGLIRGSNQPDDPLGIDSERAWAPVPNSSAVPPNRGPRPPRVKARRGAVVRAIAAVREASHQVDVHLEDGLAHVRVTQHFTNGSRHPAEVEYRLPSPEGSVLVSLDVCIDRHCRTGTVDWNGEGERAYDDSVRARPRRALDASPVSGSPTPVGHAEQIWDDRGLAFRLRAAPVPRDGHLELRLRYVAPAPVADGHVWFRMPARGMDHRAAPAQVQVKATPGSTITLDGAPVERASIPPSLAAAIAARVPNPRRARVTRARCGERDCVRAWAAAAPQPSPPTELIVLVDASPSTLGPARGRMGVALSSLLAAAPPGTRVRALAFGAHPAVLIDEPVPVDQVRWESLYEGIARALGPATRFDRAFDRSVRWLRAPRRRGSSATVVIVGDGTITPHSLNRGAARRARALRATVSVFCVSDASVSPDARALVAQTGGAIVHASRLADDVVAGRGADRLHQLARVFFAPTIARRVRVDAGSRSIALGSLRAGSEISWAGTVPTGTRVRLRLGPRRVRPHVTSVTPRKGGTPSVWSTATRVVAAQRPEPDPSPSPLPCHPRGPATHPSGVSSDAHPLALAHPRSCTSAKEPATATGVPRRTVLAMLRRHVVPPARGCLRRDRAGRTDYSVRATFQLRLANRELERVAVQGNIGRRLRQCLLRAAHDLIVPYFSKTIVVNYPIYTAREAPPPTVELAEDVRVELDAALRRSE